LVSGLEISKIQSRRVSNTSKRMVTKSRKP
jgi:hypothetical protein